MSSLGISFGSTIFILGELKANIASNDTNKPVKVKPY